MNTHGTPDMMVELDGTLGDLLPACVVSNTPPAVPASGLTLSAFGTRAYVRAGTYLTYVDQPAVTVTLVGGDGTYWLAVTDDTFSAFSGWSRRPGSHYMWRLSATRPADVDNLLCFSQLTVSGGNISAVSSPSGVALAEALRVQAGLGTMATQNAGAVAITGGTFTGASMTVSTGYATQMGIGAGTLAGAQLNLQHAKAATWHGIVLKPSDSDTGGGAEVLFLNLGSGVVGSIFTSATATTYGTSSDVRLKHAVQALGNALAAIQALRPVTFKWNSTGEQAHGFLAHELMQVVPEAVSGLPDEVNPDGTIRPQQVDHSRLVVFLVGAVQELAARLDAAGA